MMGSALFFGQAIFTVAVEAGFIYFFDAIRKMFNDASCCKKSVGVCV
jgi:hypothetical protein|tara:strand:+ start:49 stop:189 length:141 start_codon:yes stop_codon:yes gene_type:complete